jgi:hypothetical protein
MKRRVLAICSRIPFPIDNGDSLRVHHLLQQLDEKVDLEVFIVLRNDTSSFEIEEFRRLFPGKVKFFQPDKKIKPVEHQIHFWMNTLSCFTPPWIMAVYSSELRSFLRSRMSTQDVTFFLGEASGVYAKYVSAGTKVWDRSNVLRVSLKFMKNEYLPIKKLIRRFYDLFSFSFYEFRILKNIDAVSLTSRDEVRNFQSYEKNIKAVLLESTVDDAIEREEYRAKSKNILFLGNLNYEPNLEGLVRFTRETKNALDSRGFRIVVIGKGQEKIPNDLQANLDLRGYVQDLSTLPGEILCGIVPIWRGAGIKMKTLTMLSLGIPVLSTKMGFEGIPDDLALCISNSSVELISKLDHKNTSEFLSVSAKSIDFVRRTNLSQDITTQIEATFGLIDD